MIILDQQRRDGEALIAKERIKPRAIRAVHSADMQFVGPDAYSQRAAAIGATSPANSCRALFETAYFARFGVELPEIRAQLVNLNTSVIGEREPVDLSRLIDPAGRATKAADALKERRPVWFDGEWLDTPVYDRQRLPLDVRLEGPAILEQMDATTVLEPGDRAQGDADGNISH